MLYVNKAIGGNNDQVQILFIRTGSYDSGRFYLSDSTGDD